MKQLIFILFLFITLITQAQYSTPKVWNFRTSSIEGRKPINADFYGKTVYCHNITDSLIWIRLNNVITQGFTFYPYSDTIVNVHKVTVTSNTRYNAPYYQNSVKTTTGTQVPIKANFTSPNTLIITWGDSTAWQLVRGVVTKTWRIYPYNFDTIVPPPPVYPTLATRIYVSSVSGDDASINPHNPATPYKSIPKINSLTLKATDTVLFKTDETYYGNLVIRNSGTLGNPIVFTSYGTGAKPIITGLVPITTWTNLGGNIWESAATVCKSTLNLITVDGKIAQIGRYPNAGTFLTYETYTGTASITDNQLTASPNWTGAEVLIRNNGYSNQRRTITNHAGTVITYAGGNNYDMKANYGYFIQNDVRTLDADKEWYFNPATKKIRMYLSDNNPALHTIKASIYDTIILATNRNYVVLNNLQVEGGNEANIDMNGTNTGCVISYCDLNFSGTYGAYLGTISNFLFSHNTVSNSLNKGVLVSVAGVNSVFEYNTISKSGLLMGMNRLHYGYTGFETNNGDGMIVRYNSIDSSGYHGIFPRGHDNIIERNLISNFGLVLDDCGGIYMNTIQPGNKLLNNIILNGIGNPLGTNYTSSHAEGIYLDEVSSNTYVEGNTIAHCGSSGLRYHNAYNITARGNTMYDNVYNIHIIKSNVNTSYSRNLIFKQNIMVAKTSTQLAFRIYNYVTDNPLLFGTADSNYYCRPIAEGNTIQTRNVSTTVNYTLATWKTATGGDVNSYASPFAISSTSDILFEYNATTSNKIVSLTGTWKTLANVPVSGSITLLPYTSRILIR